MKNVFKKAMVTLSALTLAGAVAPKNVNADDDTIIVYTNSLDDPKKEWLETRSKEAGFNVEFVIGGGGEIFNRVMAESGDPQADVLIGMDEGQLSQIQAEGLLIEWEPEWASDIPDELKQGGKYYYPWAEQRIMGIYNEEYISADEVPATIEEWGTTEELKEKYTVPNGLGGSTNQKIVFSILLQHLDEGGELGVSEEGWDLVTKFFENGYAPKEDENKYALMADGTTPISFNFSGGIPNGEKEFEFKSTPINPEYGVFTMSEQVAVVNKGEDNDASRAIEYATWWGSPEVQAEWAKDWGTVPALESIQDSVDERVLEIFEATTRMDVNWDIVNEYGEQWVEKIELDIMP